MFPSYSTPDKSWAVASPSNRASFSITKFMADAKARASPQPLPKSACLKGHACSPNAPPLCAQIVPEWIGYNDWVMLQNCSYTRDKGSMSLVNSMIMDKNAFCSLHKKYPKLTSHLGYRSNCAEGPVNMSDKGVVTWHAAP